TEWEDWHTFMTGGLFDMLKDNPFAMVTGVKQPILICARHSTLANRSQNIRSTLKETCRRQFRKNSPGVIHILVNTRYYGIGFRAQQDRIIDDLEATAVSILKEYTRLLAIVFDIVTPPPPGSTVIQHRRLVCPHSERAANIVSKLLSIESVAII
ncbi:MAG: hypothetical protein KKH68_07320, partial [Proteobacteria bacterium]|nr:hypothetical protein [Pseudomonadota bacterium]